jgi:hypothetical protein
VMVATSNMNKNPAFLLELGNDIMTGHETIIHTIHMMSMVCTNQPSNTPGKPPGTGIIHGG